MEIASKYSIYTALIALSYFNQSLLDFVNFVQSECILVLLCDSRNLVFHVNQLQSVGWAIA